MFELISWQSVLANAGATIVIAAPIMLAAFKAFGSKTLDLWFAKRLEASKQNFQREIETQKTQFQRELEASKQAHVNELERIKFERSSILDRTTRLHQREFEIIPELWKRTTLAHDAIGRAISRMQTTPDFNGMNVDERSAYIDSSKLQPWQKVEMKALPPVQQSAYYANAMIWIQLREADTARVKFNRAYLTGMIFIHPDTIAKFEPMADLINSTVWEYRLERQEKAEGRRPDKEEVENLTKYRKEGNAIYKELSKYLRERYWISSNGDAL